MEETIALDNKSQSTFKKAFKTLKKSIKKGTVKVRSTAKQSKVKASDRGVVYLSHLPHGFYEDVLKEYFTQFGKVTAVKVVRSKKTGGSCGYGFIEFLYPDVAKVAAESMNNYLMYDRLIKATYVPPKKQKRNHFSRKHDVKPVNAETCKRARNRVKYIAEKNKERTLEEDKKAAGRIKRNLRRLEKKLADQGINYSIKPVNDPNDEDKNDDSDADVEDEVDAGASDSAANDSDTS